MTWVLWRQHRSQAALATAALTALVVVLALTGVHMAATYHSALRSCAATASCDTIGHGLFDGDGAIIDLVNLTVVVPLLIGLFWAAPLVAREVEEGTHQLVWTQSITRRRWLGAKTVALLAATTVVATVLAVSVTWWSRTMDLSQHNRFARFDIQGIVPVAYALFGASLGLTAGVLIRRTLPALAATLGVMVSLRLVIATYARPHFMNPLTTLVSLAATGTGIDQSDWTLHSHFVNSAGAVVSSAGDLSAVPISCRQFIGTTRAQMFSCLGAQGWREKIVYQPANRFWTFQGIESVIFVALAGALVVTSFVLIRRDA